MLPPQLSILPPQMPPSDLAGAQMLIICWVGLAHGDDMEGVVRFYESVLKLFPYLHQDFFARGAGGW